MSFSSRILAARIFALLASISLVIGLCVLATAWLAGRAHAPLCREPATRLLLGAGMAGMAAAGAVVLFLFRRIRYFGLEASTIAIDAACLRLGFLGARCDLPRAQIAAATIRRASLADTRVWAGAPCPVAGNVLVVEMRDDFSPRCVEMPLYGFAGSEERIARSLGAVAAENRPRPVGRPAAPAAPPAAAMAALYRSAANRAPLIVFCLELAIMGGFTLLLLSGEWQDLASPNCGGPPFPIIVVPLCLFAGLFGLMLAAILPVLPLLTPGAFAIGVHGNALWLMHGRRRLALPAASVEDITASAADSLVDIRPWAGGTTKAAAEARLDIHLAKNMRPEKFAFPAGHLGESPQIVAATLKAALRGATAND